MRKRNKKRSWNKKQAQGDAHSRSQGANPSKQCFPPGVSPAEHWRPASACYVKCSERRVNDDEGNKDDDGHFVFPINSSAPE